MPKTTAARSCAGLGLARECGALGLRRYGWRSEGRGVLAVADGSTWRQGSRAFNLIAPDIHKILAADRIHAARELGLNCVRDIAPDGRLGPLVAFLAAFAGRCHVLPGRRVRIG